jgi:hypothetical protein
MRYFAALIVGIIVFIIMFLFAISTGMDTLTAKYLAIAAGLIAAAVSLKE